MQGEVQSDVCGRSKAVGSVPQQHPHGPHRLASPDLVCVPSQACVCVSLNSTQVHDQSKDDGHDENAGIE